MFFMPLFKAGNQLPQQRILILLLVNHDEIKTRFFFVKIQKLHVVLLFISEWRNETPLPAPTSSRPSSALLT